MKRVFSDQRKVTVTIIAAGLLLFLALGAVFYSALGMARENSNVRNMHRLYSALADLEGGLGRMGRGLEMLEATGREEFRRDALSAQAAVSNHLTWVRTLLAGEHEWSEKGMVLTRRVSEEVEQCRKIVESVSPPAVPGASRPPSPALQAKGESAFQVSAAMRVGIHDALAAAQLRVDRGSSRIRWAAAITAALTASFLAVGHVFVRGSLRTRQQTEEALRESAETLSLALSSIEDGVLTADSEGRIERMNPAAERMTGWPMAEAKGRLITQVFRVINEATRRPTRVSADAALLSGEPCALDRHCILVSRDGRERAVADTSAPIRNSAGRGVGVVMVFRDVTEQRAMGREVEKLARIAALTENMVILTDSKRRIEWVNDAFTRITGYTLEEVHGRSPSLLQGPESNPETILAIRGRLAAGEGFRGEIVNYAKGGRKYWAVLEIQPFRDSLGNLTGFMSIQSDVTERKEMEAEFVRLKAQRG